MVGNKSLKTLSNRCNVHDSVKPVNHNRRRRGDVIAPAGGARALRPRVSGTMFSTELSMWV